MGNHGIQGKQTEKATDDALVHPLGGVTEVQHQTYTVTGRLEVIMQLGTVLVRPLRHRLDLDDPR
jgi:hypothetical protein